MQSNTQQPEQCDAVLDRFLRCTIPLAVTAGQAILDVAREPLDVQAKTDGSPLTRADLASHHIIVAGLSELEPSYPVLSEESAESFDAERAGAVYWCVDPLDGTKEFVKRLDDYTVNIALVRGGVPILGVIHIPALDRLYYAAEGCGAWRLDRAAAAVVAGSLPAGAVPLPVRRASTQAPLIAVASRSHPSPETNAFLERSGITEVLRHGSSLKICAVADGSADVYPRFGPTCLWDTAAGAAIARTAGCKVTTTDGQVLRYDLAEGLKHSGFIVFRASRIQPRFNDAPV